MDNFNRQVLRVAVAQICQSMGWDALQKSTHDTLTDVMQRYLEEIGKVAYGYTQLCKCSLFIRRKFNRIFNPRTNLNYKSKYKKVGVLPIRIV